MTTVVTTTSVIMDGNCKLNRQSCPPGHEMVACEVKKFFTCKECDPAKNFQPNVNREGDKCRLKRVCDKPFMDYKSGGTKTSDAECECRTGFHFENEDQRACVPNSVCQIGYGQGKYGNCEPCIALKKFSNKTDRYQPCLPTTDCESQGRCIVKKSNGSYDNECSPPLKDISKCGNLTSAELLKLLKGEEGTSTAVIVGAVVGSIVALIVIALLTLIILVVLSRRKKKRCDCHVTSADQLDDLKRRVIEKSEKDPTFCKKTLDTSFRDIEDNINRQIWSFAQELFRTHYQSGKYEVVVEKYKNLHRKAAVNNYLQEWRNWRGYEAESVRILFESLQKCGRPEIIYEICNKLSPSIDGTNNLMMCTSTAHNRALKPSIKEEVCDILFPCGRRKEGKNQRKELSNTETTKTLLSGQQSDVETASGARGIRPCPSAPNFPSQTENEFGPYHANRQFSIPIQVSE